ncbi:MAG: hypothetical protein K0U34_04565, partial [Alphaproteobacteria bacterium]|nr:hypothetical protein [Alphaproteobacteria bacterium]
MASLIARAVKAAARTRWSLLTTTADITARPSTFADGLAQTQSRTRASALRFFLQAVGLVLAIETIFSLVFDTA